MGFAGTGGFGGGGGGTSGGSTGGGSSNNSGRERLVDTDFGGLPRDRVTGGQENLLCEEAGTIVIPDNGTTIEQKYPGIEDTNPNYKTDYPVYTKPAGEGANVISISIPSFEESCAKNFINGTPNQSVIINPGKHYFFNNTKNSKLAYPSVYIRGYRGNPVPVTDPTSGELVAILTNCQSWDPNFPGVGIGIIPDNSEIGISTDDPNYDIVVGGFFISNTGRNYCNPTISVYDRDRGSSVGAEAKAIVSNGRIVDVEVINNGTGFRRLPEIKVFDDSISCGTTGGLGARIYPIMSVVARPNAKPFPIPVQMIYCPSKNQRNLY